MRNASDGVEAEPSAPLEPADEPSQEGGETASEHPFSRAREARSRSAAVREDAEALHAHSGHQQRRARRNLAMSRVDVGRVLVVDDSRVFRQVAHSVVSATTRLRPFGEAGSGEEAVRMLSDLKPDLVLLDVHMPGLDGLETASVIHSESPRTVVVLMSADSDGVEEAGWSAHAVAVLDKRDLLPRTLDEIWLQHGPDRRD